jgi:hypothetical protein
MTDYIRNLHLTTINSNEEIIVNMRKENIKCYKVKIKISQVVTN